MGKDQQLAQSSSGSQRILKTRRVLGFAKIALPLMLVGAIVGWSATAVFGPSTSPIESPQYTYAQVDEGEVGYDIAVTAVAEWTPVPAGSSLAVGTVTSVLAEPGGVIDSGTVLYTVNLRAVSAAQGSVPAFRSLSQGTTGEDVRQLQALLAHLGFYGGAIDGSFGGGTTLAVINWQKSIGSEPDGVVGSGDVIFFPELPARISINPDIVYRGANLVGGERAIQTLPVEPQFSVPVTANQAGQIPIGTLVEINGSSDEKWNATVDSQTTDAKTGEVSLLLSSTTDDAICRTSCASIPVLDSAIFPARAITVQPTTGLVIPSAALLTEADGQLYVVDEENQVHGVVVVVSAQGMSVVRGVDAGLRVRIPATLE